MLRSNNARPRQKPLRDEEQIFAAQKRKEKMALPVLTELKIDRSRYDAHNKHDPAFEAPPGVNEAVVRIISEHKKEPDWMLQKRLQGLKLYQQTPLPTWGPSLQKLELEKIKYFITPKAKESTKMGRFA